MKAWVQPAEDGGREIPGAQALRRGLSLLDIVAVPVGFGVVALIGKRDREPNVRALARQAGAGSGRPSGVESTPR